MGGRSKYTFLTGQEVHEKMLKIREMKMKTIRNHLTLVRMAITIKNLQTINAGEGIEKKEPSYTVGENICLCSHYGEQYGGSLKN